MPGMIGVMQAIEAIKMIIGIGDPLIGRLVSFDALKLRFKEFKIRTTTTAGTGLTPHLITVDPSGNLWWSEGWVSSIGKLNPAVAKPGTNTGVAEYSYAPSCGSCGSHTSGIAADISKLSSISTSISAATRGRSGSIQLVAQAV